MQLERTLTGHKKWIWGMIQLKDERICSCSGDGTLKVWNQNTFSCEINIDISSKWLISVIEIKGGKVA